MYAGRLGARVRAGGQEQPRGAGVLCMIIITICMILCMIISIM